MRATSRRDGGKLRQTVEVREHVVAADEPKKQGGDDSAPSPQELLAASLASCTAITMEMYAERKGWDLGDARVDVDMEYGEAYAPDSFIVHLHLPRELSPHQLERLKEIAGRCPVHRVLSERREVTIQNRIEPL
jgi:putative redox protein